MKLVPVTFDGALEGNEIVGLEGGVEGRAVAPDLGIDRSACICEAQIDEITTVPILPAFLLDEKGEAGKLKIFNEVGEIAQVAELDEATTRDLRSIIFSTDSDSLRFAEGLDKATAAILMESARRFDEAEAGDIDVDVVLEIDDSPL